MKALADAVAAKLEQDYRGLVEYELDSLSPIPKDIKTIEALDAFVKNRRVAYLSGDEFSIGKDPNGIEGEYDPMLFRIAEQAVAHERGRFGGLGGGKFRLFKPVLSVVENTFKYHRPYVLTIGGEAS